MSICCCYGAFNNDNQKVNMSICYCCGAFNNDNLTLLDCVLVLSLWLEEVTKNTFHVSLFVNEIKVGKDGKFINK